MGGETQKEDPFIGVARPLLMTVITTLRPDLPPIAAGMAVEQIVLELDVGHEMNYWETVRLILADLLSQGAGRP